MIASAAKGNLANAGIVLEDGNVIAQSESLVVSDSDATAHSERLLVSEVCKQKYTNYTPGLTLITVVEPCLMCLSACQWGGYARVGYIIPADRYLAKIPWMAETKDLDKTMVVKTFANPMEYIHMKAYEETFASVFEEAMKSLLQ